MEQDPFLTPNDRGTDCYQLMLWLALQRETVMLVIRSLMFCAGVMLAATSLHPWHSVHRPDSDGKSHAPTQYVYPRYA